jgi:site-specific recombinase XerD
MPNQMFVLRWADVKADLARWLTNLSRGSSITAEVYERRLKRTCELLEATPSGLLERATSDFKGFQDSIEDMVTLLESEQKSPGYIRGLLKSLRSWLRYNDVQLTRKIKVSNPSATPTIEDEEIPSHEELSRILRASSSRVRVAEVLIAFADLRPHTLGNYNGSDGLTLRDLPELRIENGQVLFQKVPTMILVRPILSKARHKYFTFLSEEGCTYLKEYLEERLRQGEKLQARSPVIAYERTSARREFMTTRKISRMIREAMRQAGVWKRPYVLRAYAETQFIIAESKGKISHPYLQFMAGHKGDIESRYSTNKGVLPEEMIEGMRESYKACEPFLSTISQPLEHSSIVKEAKVEALKSIAKSMLGIDLLEVKVAKEKEINKELDLDEEIELFENEIRKIREPKDDPQIIIREEELQSYLKEGWQFVSILPSNKILIRK